MAIKKTELYTSLWASCDELRGSMDASEYKNYVLMMLFMKYVSDKYLGDPKALLEVPEGGSFDDIVALKGKPHIGEGINKVIAKFAQCNGLESLFGRPENDFNNEEKLGKGKDMIDCLSNLVGIFQGLDLRANRADGDDLLGDAYEYLMRNFATQSGKSKGQFYTPSEVSRILAKVVGITAKTRQDQTVYDPTCGSGSLLLKVANEAPRGLSIFGQEMEYSTWVLAKMNMILHDNVTAELWKDNTLSSPYWKEPDGGLKRFDFAVANPPFSFKSWGNGVNVGEDPFGRFEYGTPPDKNGDYAFLLHILKSLKSTGKAAVILPHGVLFRGNAEARIREKLVTQRYVKGIIGLPPNLFYGTGIPACIIVLDKEEAKDRSGIFMVDASRGFMKDGNKNRLRSQDIHKIVDVFNRQMTVDRYSRMVPLTEIKKNDYNLNIPRYIDGSEPEDLHDLSGHLSGGIPNRDLEALGVYWQVLPKVRKALFAKGDRPGYSCGRVEAGQVKATILNHPEFEAFSERALVLYEDWFAAHEKALRGITIGDKPKALIDRLSEDLLERFGAVALLDRYDIYQMLMDYWAEVMQDDVYALAQDGWAAGKVLRELVVKKGEKRSETPDLVIGKQKYKAELIGPGVIVGRYFVDKQAYIDELQVGLDGVSQELEALCEEHSGEEGLLVEAQSEAGKVTKALVVSRLKEIKGDRSAQEERSVLQRCLALLEQEAEQKKAAREAQEALDRAVFGQYGKLSEAEVRELVVVDKWRVTLRAAVVAEVERAGQQLANRVRDLEERYAVALPELVERVDELSGRVDEHLKRMGLVWS